MTKFIVDIEKGYRLQLGATIDVTYMRDERYSKAEMEQMKQREQD